MIETGSSYREAARLYDISHVTLYRYFKKKGIQPPNSDSRRGGNFAKASSKQK